MIINLKRNWNEFVKKALDKIVYMNQLKEDDHIMYVFNYEGDNVEMILADIMGYSLAHRKSISVDKEQYYSGDVDDDEFIEDCIKRISP